MKIRNPYDKDRLKINKSDYVLEVGPGSNPSRRANVLIEKFIDDNHHRRGDLKIYHNQKLLQADGEQLPFADKEFDYVICSHVLEHVDDPKKFVSEQSRVAKRGYMEAPSLIGEFLAPKESHRWVILEIDDKLIMFEKSKLPYNFHPDFGDLFLNYLPYQSIPFRLLVLTRNDFLAVRYEWKESIDIIINPEDEYYSSFFLQRWSPDMVKKIFPPISSANEIKNTFKALFYFALDKFRRGFNLNGTPLSIEEYLKQKPD